MFQGLCVQQVRLGFSPPPSVGFVPQFPHPNHRAALLEDPQQDLFKAGLFWSCPSHATKLLCWGFHSFSHLKGREIIFLSFNIMPEGIGIFFPFCSLLKTALSFSNQLQEVGSRNERHEILRSLQATATLTRVEQPHF